MVNTSDKTKRLIGKWGKRINMVESAQRSKMTYEKKAALAHSLENLSSRIKVQEATNPSSIGLA